MYKAQVSKPEIKNKRMVIIQLYYSSSYLYSLVQTILMYCMSKQAAWRTENSLMRDAFHLDLRNSKQRSLWQGKHQNTATISV